MKKRVKELRLFVIIINFAFLANAQIVTDGSLGPPATDLTGMGPNITIDDSLGRLVGPNLFHSFSDFNVNSGESATFTGPASVGNILSRVTGDNVSNINGILKSEIEGANFFFMNPNGIVFGEGASLNIPGAVTFTTADYIRLNDGGRFDATELNNELLTSAPPEAYGFLAENGGNLGINNAQIVNSLPITLIGRDIEMDGSTIAVPGSRLNLISTRSEGEVALDVTDLASEVNLQSFTNLGNINIKNSPHPNPAINLNGLGGGRLMIFATNLALDNAVITSNNEGPLDGLGLEINVESIDLINNSTISTTTLFSQGGDIKINAGNVTISLGSSLTASTFAFGKGGTIIIGNEDKPSEIVTLVGRNIAADTTAIVTQTVDVDISEEMGIGGDIIINTNLLEIVDGAFLSATTLSSGAGGKVNISANEIILRHGQVLNTFTGIGSPTINLSRDNAGNSNGIRIAAEKIGIHNGAQINASTFGFGDGGDIQIDAQTIIIDGNKETLEFSGIATRSIFSSVIAENLNPENIGNAGLISVRVDNLTMLGKAIISTTTLTGGDAGRILIKGLNAPKAESILLSGNGIGSKDFPNMDFQGLITSIDAQTVNNTIDEAGRGGEIRIFSRNLEILQGGQITTSTASRGTSGQIDITADRIFVSGDRLGPISGIDSQTQGIGDGGDITIISSEVSVEGLAQISAESEITAAGDGGNLNISTDYLNINNGAVIENSNDGNGKGGNIILTVNKRISMNDSLITARSVGDGGNIAIDSKALVLSNSDLLANAIFRSGGNIEVESEVFLASSDSKVDASSDLGISGNINITAPDIDIAGSLAVLPETFYSGNIQLQDSCAIKLTADLSSFIAVGRGGIPIEPGGILPEFIGSTE